MVMQLAIDPSASTKDKIDQLILQHNNLVESHQELNVKVDILDRRVDTLDMRVDILDRTHQMLERKMDDDFEKLNKYLQNLFGVKRWD